METLNRNLQMEENPLKSLHQSFYCWVQHMASVSSAPSDEHSAKYREILHMREVWKFPSNSRRVFWPEALQFLRSSVQRQFAATAAPWNAARNSRRSRALSNPNPALSQSKIAKSMTRFVACLLFRFFFF
jgi:hypothetical protein